MVESQPSPRSISDAILNEVGSALRKSTDKRNPFMPTSHAKHHSIDSAAEEVHPYLQKGGLSPRRSNRYGNSSIVSIDDLKDV